MKYIICNTTKGGGRYVIRNYIARYKCIDTIERTTSRYGGGFHAYGALIFDTYDDAARYLIRNSHWLTYHYDQWYVRPYNIGCNVLIDMED